MEEEPRGERAPAEITHLVRERTEARRLRDWGRADRLKREIEAAGWKVVDVAGRTTVSPAAVPDVEVSGERRYGSWRTVPSRLGDEPRPGACVVIVASEEPARATELVEALAPHAPAGTQLVVVVNDPSAEQERLLPGYREAASERLAIDVVRTATRLGYAAALNVGLHLAATEIVVIADGSAVPDGDAISPLTEALADPGVAVAGGFGLASTDLSAFRPSAIVPTDDRLVAAIELAWLGFRRSDYATLGPLNEGFATPAWLDVWWSFRLREGPFQEELEDDGREPTEADLETLDGATTEPASTDGTARAESEPPDSETPASDGSESEAPELESPRAAVRLDLPLVRVAATWPPARTHFARRNSYRIIRTFGPDRALLESADSSTATTRGD